MSESVVVVFSDIVGWATQENLTTQIATAQWLFQAASMKLKTNGLTPRWKTSTGDGFAIALARERAVLALQFAVELHDEYQADTGRELRLAVAEGSVERFENPLTQQSDCTGPAVIKARRILDGITGGNTLLLDEPLFDDCKGQLPRVVRDAVVQHPDLVDKHGHVHHVVQVLRRPEAQKRPAPADWINRTKSASVKSLEAAVGVPLLSMDSLVFMWLSSTWGAMEATGLRVHGPALRGTALDYASLPELGGVVAEYTARFRAEAAARFGEPNKPKLWIKEYRSPVGPDRPTLDIELGRSDYWTQQALELAFREGTIRREYESRALDIKRDLPGSIVAHVIVVTIDRHIILSQRESGDVDGARDTYSPSFEEQWDPLQDPTPTDTVLRGLHEEFNVDVAHGVRLTVDNVSVVGLAREWGPYWQTALCYLVRLPATAANVFECWESVPPPMSKNEHKGLLSVSLLDQVARDSLERLLEPTRKLRLQEFAAAEIAGTPSDGDLHPTSGRARLVVGLSAFPT